MGKMKSLSEMEREGIAKLDTCLEFKCNECNGWFKLMDCTDKHARLLDEWIDGISMPVCPACYGEVLDDEDTDQHNHTA